jgi:hypothetical protein
MAGPVQMPVDGVDRHDLFVVMRQVPGDGLRPIVKALAGKPLPQFDDEIDCGLRRLILLVPHDGIAQAHFLRADPGGVGLCVIRDK